MDLFESAGHASPHPLREYQDRGVRDIRAAFGRRHRRVLFQMATGGGKTRVIAEVVRLAREKGNKVVLLAPRRELVYQIVEALYREGVKAGIIMAGEEQRYGADINVCSFDTLHARAIQRTKIALPQADLVVCDEAHLAVADSRQEILNAYSNAKHLLVTATPARGDGAGLCAIADELVLGPSMSELIELGHLLPLRYFAPSEPDLKAVKLNKDGDYQEKALGKVMDAPKLIGDIVDNWERIAVDRSTVVFCVKRTHSRHMAEEFKSRGYTAEHLDGETPADERAAILARVDSGETQVLCNVFVASYGLDIPRLSCAVLARPTKNLTLYLQTVGRIMRPFEDQVDGLVIDHAGAIKENGFADEDHPWSLDGKEKIKDRIKADKEAGSEPKEIKCPKCATVFKARRTCPMCGFQVIAPTEKIPVHEADLQEIVRGKETAAQKRNRTTPKEQKAQFYAELKRYAQDKRKSDGWVSHTYQAAFGVWPNAFKSTPAASAVSEQTARYIRSRQIAYAKSRAA